MSLEVYEPLLTSANPPQVAAGYKIREKASGKEVVSTGAVKLDELIQNGSPMIPVGLAVSVKDLAPGSYELSMMAVESPATTPPTAPSTSTLQISRSPHHFSAATNFNTRTLKTAGCGTHKVGPTMVRARMVYSLNAS